MSMIDDTDVLLIKATLTEALKDKKKLIRATALVRVQNSADLEVYSSHWVGDQVRGHC